jgi:hypothetical protein
MDRRMQGNMRRLVVLALSGLLWTGCGGKDAKEQELAASLPELPDADVAKLKPVPNSQLLGTSELQRVRQGGAPQTASTPPCPKDDTILDFSAQVTYPITVCSFHAAGAMLTESSGLTHKLSNTSLPAGLKVAAAKQSPSGEIPSSLWRFCKKDSGPWQADLSSDHPCSGTCGTYNRLTLTNSPNPVEWDWYG